MSEKSEEVIRVIDRYGRCIYDSEFVVESKGNKMLHVSHPHFPGKSYKRNSREQALRCLVDEIGSIDEKWVIDRMVPCVKLMAKSGQCVTVTHDKVADELLVCLGLNVVVLEGDVTGVLAMLLLDAVVVGELAKERLEDVVGRLGEVKRSYEGWRDIESLESGVEVLLCLEGDDEVWLGEWDGNGYFWVGDNSYNGGTFTHWMPLPKAVGVSDE